MKKKNIFKAAVLGVAVMTVGTCVGIPAFVPSTVMAATEVAQAAGISDRVTVTRTYRFYYKNDDGSVKPVKSSEGGDFKITRSVIFSGGDKSVAEIAGYEVPSISGYTPDKTYIEPLKVTADSKPDDVIVYYTQDPAQKKTYDTESKDLSRKITFYRMEDNGQAVQTYSKTQYATVNRTVIIDGNGKKTYGEWQTVTFSSESVPTIAGYTPSLYEVPAVTVSPDNPPLDVKVYYEKTVSDERILADTDNIMSFTVTFTDGMGKTLKTQKVTVTKGATAPEAPIRKGYTFAGWDKDFSKISSDLIVNAKWEANKTELVNESKTVRRTISYFYTDGKPVISTEGKAASEYYQWTFKRNGVKDVVTGNINWSDWSAATTFPEQKVMHFPGYTPDKSKIPAQVVDHNSKSWEIKVYYTKDGAKPVRTDTYTGVRYQDEAWRFVKGGIYDNTYTGVARSTTGNWVFVRKGIVDFSYTGVAQSTTGNWVFVRKGRFDSTYTGVARSTTGNWVFVRNGRVVFNHVGVARSTTGNWVFVRKGRFDPTYTGVAQSTTGNWVFVRKGRFDPTYTGVAQSTTGNWVFVKKGRFDPTYTGVTQSITGNWVYVKNGRFNSAFTGAAKDMSGKTVNVMKGRLV